MSAFLKSRPDGFSRAVPLCLLCGVAAFAVPVADGGYESFEAARVPAEWSASRPGSLAPGSAPGGTVFFDLIVYNGILDFRAHHIPDSHAFAPEARELRDRYFPRPGSIAADERAGVDRAYRGLVAQMTNGTGATESFLHEDPADRVRYLRAFARRVSADIPSTTEGDRTSGPGHF